MVVDLLPPRSNGQVFFTDEKCMRTCLQVKYKMKRDTKVRDSLTFQSDKVLLSFLIFTKPWYSKGTQEYQEFMIGGSIFLLSLLFFKLNILGRLSWGEGRKWRINSNKQIFFDFCKDGFIMIMMCNKVWVFNKLKPSLYYQACMCTRKHLLWPSISRLYMNHPSMDRGSFRGLIISGTWD